MDPIKTLWEEYISIPYPDDAHLQEMKLELLDTYMAGCISSYISNNGKLDQKQVTILKKGIVELEQEIEKIPETAKDHFIKLKTLGELVLKTYKLEL